jgi:VWFA-related protein
VALGLSRRSRFGVAAVLAGSAFTPLTQRTNAQAGQPPQDRIRVGVELVTTAVTVRDRAGRFLPDLKPGEIEVYEDGVKQTIVALSLSQGGRLFDVGAAPTSPPSEGYTLPPLRPVKDKTGRVFVLFVDDLHLEPSQTPRVRDLFGQIVEQVIHEGDLFAVVSTGPSSIAMDLTYDRRRLDLAKSKIVGSGQRIRDILDAPSGADGPPEVRHRVHVAFATAHDLLQQLGGLRDRRTSFIYISSGYDLNPFPEERDKAERERLGATDENPFRKQATFSEADLVSQLAELTRAARRANVAIYTIDPRGLVGGPDISEKIDMVAFQRHVSKTQDTLRVLAEQTGGRALVNKNDFAKGLALIDTDTSDYYVVGYYSTNADTARRRRTIEIKVGRPNVDVVYGTEYSLKPRSR